MASKSRKRVFPKPPKPLYYGKLDRGTAENLGKNSNKGGYMATLQAIYNQMTPNKSKGLDERQATQLAKLKENLDRRKDARLSKQRSIDSKD